MVKLPELQFSNVEHSTDTSLWKTYQIAKKKFEKQKCDQVDVPHDEQLSQKEPIRFEMNNSVFVPFQKGTVPCYLSTELISWKLSIHGANHYSCYISKTSPHKCTSLIQTKILAVRPCFLERDEKIAEVMKSITDIKIEDDRVIISCKDNKTIDARGVSVENVSTKQSEEPKEEPDPDTVFINACESGDLDTVKECIQNGQDPRVNCNEALEIASHGGHLSVVKYLCETFVPGTFCGVNPSTCLVQACLNGHLPIVEYLCETFELTINETMDNLIKFAKTDEIRDYLQGLIHNETETTGSGTEKEAVLEALNVITEFIKNN